MVRRTDFFDDGKGLTHSDKYNEYKLMRVSKYVYVIFFLLFFRLFVCRNQNEICGIVIVCRLYIERKRGRERNSKFKKYEKFI